MGNVTTLKCKGETDVKNLAGAISHEMAKGKHVEIVYIGAGAGQQAVKAFIIASGWAAQQARCLVMKAGFRQVKIEERDMSAIVLRVFEAHTAEIISAEPVLDKDIDKHLEATP